MKRTVLFLVSALIVFVGTLLITNDYMTRESIAEADRINDLQVQGIRKRMDVNLLLREKSVHCFLSGLLNYHIFMKDTVLDTVATISDEMVSRFPSNVYNTLKEFEQLNPHILQSVFAVDTSVYSRIYPEGFAPCIVGGDTTQYDLADKYDFMSSQTYKILKKNGDCLWRLPHKGSPMRGLTVTYYVPIHRESGTFFGYFAININLAQLRDEIIESLPYGKENSAVIISDENDKIILATDSMYLSFDKLSDIDYALSHNLNIKKEVSESAHHDIYSFMGEKYYIYHSTMQQAPWHVITICKENAIYKDVLKTRNAILIVAFLGMLIMLGCCIVVFHQMRSSLLKKAAVEDELNMAAGVQMSMLRGHDFKTSQAVFHAFLQPAREAGGDLYDYVEKDGKLIFCIGDVSGKGMPAALFMTQVISLFRNVVRYSANPEDIMKEINNVLSENNPAMTFCTCIVGVIDGNTLKYCSAGHNPPILLCPKPTFLTPHPNIALGLMEGFRYQSDSISLHPADRILFYTDGVTEAMNIRHEMYGDDRLVKTVAKCSDADEICTSVLESIHDFVQDAPQSDDITMISIKKL